ncbi:MAG: DHH family phosphoesterase [Bacilli bacterium]|nr:DHH family phosphoesterase [Bacilli bacterium]
MKEKALRIIEDLRNYDELYIIGHNNIDCDSYFSSYLLYKVLNYFGLNTHFCILDDYNILEEDKKQINDFKKEEPIVVKRSEIESKTFVLVDHNDPEQSSKNDNCNIILSIDHHIETNKVKNCYSIEYTSTGLLIYDLFKDVYNFSNELKDIIALTVMSDSCFLTTSRFKDSDKELFKELNSSLDVNEMRKRYFRTTNFSLDIDFNITNNHKVYHVDDMEINRVIIKGYENDKKYIDEYVRRSNEIYSNNLFIFNEFENLETYVYFKGNILKTYDHIVTSSMLITKDLIKEIKNIH